MKYNFIYILWYMYVFKTIYIYKQTKMWNDVSSNVWNKIMYEMNVIMYEIK